jgi:hypothetical protein
MIAGRRSYADVFLPLSSDRGIRESKLYFYDLNLKANYELSDKDRLYVSGYFGRDVLGLSELFKINWGNATATLRWNHLVNEKMFVNTSLVYSDFNYGFDIKFAENASFGLDQAINDIYIKSDWTNYLNPNSKLNFGGQVTYHRFNPGLFSPNNDETREVFQDIQLEKKKAAKAEAAKLKNEKAAAALFAKNEEVQVLRDEYDNMSKRLLRELERFNGEKIILMNSIIEGFAKLEAKCNADMEKNWSSLGTKLGGALDAEKPAPPVQTA